MAGAYESTAFSKNKSGLGDSLRGLCKLHRLHRLHRQCPLQPYNLLTFFQLQLIERAPIRRAFASNIRAAWVVGNWRGTNAAAFAIAVRISRETEENVLPHEWSEVDFLRAGQFDVDGEIFHFDLESETFEASDALQLDWLSELTVGPKRAFRNPCIERITQRPGAARLLGIKLRQGTLFLVLEMQPIGGNLTQMNFHTQNL